MPDISVVSRERGNKLGVWNVGFKYAKLIYCTCESNQRLQQGFMGEMPYPFSFLHYTAIHKFNLWTARLVFSKSLTNTLTHFKNSNWIELLTCINYAFDIKVTSEKWSFFCVLLYCMFILSVPDWNSWILSGLWM